MSNTPGAAVQRDPSQVFATCCLGQPANTDPALLQLCSRAALCVMCHHLNAVCSQQRSTVAAEEPFVQHLQKLNRLSGATGKG